MEPTDNPLPDAFGSTIKQPVRQPNITAAGVSFNDVSGAMIGNRPVPMPRPAPVNVLRADQQRAAPMQNPRESSGVITQAQFPYPPVQQAPAQVQAQPKAASPAQQDQALPWWAGVPTTETRTGLELEQARRAAAGGMASTDPMQAVARFGVMGSGQKQQQPQAAPTPASGPVSAASGFAPVNPLGAKADPLMQPNENAQFMTGQGGKAPDSSGNGFFDGKTAYTVNPTSQPGIQKVTAAGKNPLITNIRPEDAVSGLNNQTIPGETQEGIARFQRANDIRQSMINAQPAGGVAILPDQNADWNAAFDKRREVENISDMMRRATSKSERAAYGQALSQIISGQNQLAVETMRGQNQLASDQGRNSVTMRGQDLQSQAEAARLAGNPLANELTKTQIAAGQQANAKGQAQNDLLAKIRGETDPAKRMALIDSLMAGQGKNPAEHRYVKVDGGEEIGPDGITKIKRPSGVFDTQTQQFIPMTPQAGGNKQGGSAPPAALAYLKANPAQAEAFKAKYGYLPEGL